MTNAEYIRRKAGARTSGPGWLHLQEQHILGQIAFHDAGAQWYAQQGDTMLEEWSRKAAAEWRENLRLLKYTSANGEAFLQ